MRAILETWCAGLYHLWGHNDQITDPVRGTVRHKDQITDLVRAARGGGQGAQVQAQVVSKHVQGCWVVISWHAGCLGGGTRIRSQTEGMRGKVACRAFSVCVCAEACVPKHIQWRDVYSPGIFATPSPSSGVSFIPST